MENNTQFGIGAIGIIVAVAAGLIVLVVGGAYGAAASGMGGPMNRVAHLFGFLDERQVTMEATQNFLGHETVDLHAVLEYIGETADQSRSGQTTTRMQIDTEGTPVPGNPQASELSHSSRVMLRTPKESLVSGDTMQAEVTYTQLNLPSNIFFKVNGGVFHPDFATSEFSDPIAHWLKTTPDERALIGETFPSPAIDALAGCADPQAAMSVLADVSVSDLVTDVRALDGGSLFDEFVTYELRLDQDALDGIKTTLLEVGQCEPPANRLADAEFFTTDRVELTVNVDTKEIDSMKTNVRFKDAQYDGSIRVESRVYEYDVAADVTSPEEAMPVTELLEMHTEE